MTNDELGPLQRTAALDTLSDGEVDVVIIGGGVTGAGCALDAATRGLKVALLEQRDLASGTSSRSSKLIHGGLRYLEQLDFRLVFEALQERSLLADHLAPHLVRPVSFLYPLTHRFWERPYVAAGVGLYDLFASRGPNPLPRHRHLTRTGVGRIAPSLDPSSHVGAVMYWDAQVDDARHTLAVARTAAAHGAHIMTSTRVTGMLRSGDRVNGVTARCLETGRDLRIRSRCVVNATGVWSDDIQEMVGQGHLRVRASKGIHLVVPRDRIDAGTGIILRTEKSVLFVIPWRAHWIIGTTDTDWDLDRAHPAASRADIAYLLTQVNGVLRRPLGLDDIQGVYAGLRPLLSGESNETSKLSREHAVARPVPGVVSVAGGKFTTYRVMAADAIDAAIDDLGRPVVNSVTARTPLIGAAGHAAFHNRQATLAADTGLGPATIDHLLARYGDRIGDILDLVSDEPDLGQPLTENHPYLRAEIVHAARAEGALHLDDVLTRRTRLSIESWDRATDIAEETALLMGDELGWEDDRRADEVWHYRARVDAERDSQLQADDRTADASRLGAPDVRRGAT
ncbi:MAG: glycerol-3-phosphate dehydrogenase/oxidase [Actinomycetota bacterium]|nr:glycerol-3-phosphate dehydrogenase/oxidase [Actinomycetota bacterium]